MAYIEHMLPVARDRMATIRQDALLTSAARLLDASETNLVVVCDGSGIMVGVVTKTDIVRKIGACEGRSCATAVATVMSKDVTSCRPGDVVRDVWTLMKTRGLRHVPLVDATGRPLGVVTARDMLLALLDETEHEETLLRDYVMGIGYR